MSTLDLSGTVGAGGQTPIGGDTPEFLDGTQTYSEQELNDPNSIITAITDQRTPLVVMFGARTIGKTMALIRLTRYLESKSYTVTPDPIFRPAYDTRYKALCKNFRDVVYSPTTGGGTGVVNFMLVKVSNKRRSFCQIVEAPGEHYFDEKDVTQGFKLYLNNIFNCPNRKVWVFFLAKNWGNDQVMRDHLAERIRGMKSGNGAPLVKPKDKVVFVCAKVDDPDCEVPFLNNGRPNIDKLHEEISQQFSERNINIFEPYENHHPISRLWRAHNYEFVPFSAGTFNPAQNGAEYYVAGDDYYPAMLWDAIIK